MIRISHTRRLLVLQLNNHFRSYSGDFVSVSSPAKCEKDHSLIGKHLKMRIKASGPLTIADYMREILTHPQGGYYMQRDALGPAGDFITSPELGQVFGELIAIWFLNEWSKAGGPKPLQLVELGPGRGTLCHDILRVFQHFRMLDAMAVHLVEISPLMSEIQARRLCAESKLSQHDHVVDQPATAIYTRSGQTIQGVPIQWHQSLKDVPKDVFTLLIAQEFFDALPIHKLRRTADGHYREVLVDINSDSSTNGFRFVLAREATPASKLYVESGEARAHVEVSPASLVLMQEIAERVKCDGGFALIADYGHEGTGLDTFRAFRKHQLHDPLVEPGTADLTADVDFAALKRAAQQSDGVLVYGPIKQSEFLRRMNIEERVRALEKNAKDDEQRQGLRRGLHMMTDDDQMGTRFKFLCVAPSTMKAIYEKHPIVGFHDF